MNAHVNQLGQPIGFAMPNWEPRPRPPRDAIDGRFCRLELFDPDRHCAELFDAYAEDKEGRTWTYLAYGPFAGFGGFRDLMQAHFFGQDLLCHIIIDRTSGRAAGMASYMRIDPAMGSIEVGSIAYSPRLQKSRAATETMYLMMRRAFDELGYRRYEWKCDALNAPSRQAAERLGFRFEGFFAKHWSTRAATATPPGTRSSTASGRPSKRRSSAGSTREISMARDANGRACRR